MPVKLVTFLIHMVQDPARALSSTLGCRIELDEEEKRRQVFLALIKNAKTYHEWHRAAVELDELEGNEEWKNNPYSPDFDFELIQSRLTQLEQARASYDVRRILFLVRTSLSRNLGDTGNIRLYSRSHTGTKRLIEDYISCAVSAISTLLTLSSSNPLRSDAADLRISNHEILEGLLATRQAFGRTALLFSGGATFGMYHVGVLKALFEANMLPRIISGASAGAIVSSVLCTRTDEELPMILQEFPYGNLDVFEDSKHPDSVLARIARFLRTGAFLDITHLTKVTRELFGDITFVEAHNRTRRILNICVSSTSLYEVPKLLNYITAPNVLVWSAVAASCSVPFIFSSAPILEKDPKTGLPIPWNPSPQKWIDGSVDNDLPITRLSELFNINHFVVSQVNPHIAPFLSREDYPLSDESEMFSPWSLSFYSRPTYSYNVESWGTKVTKLVLGEVLHRMNMLAEVGIFRTLLTKTTSILSQKYYGDITLLPEVNIQAFSKLLKNPTREFLLDAILKGERATWPKLSRIRNHCAVEIALDKAILQLRANVVFDPAKQDLRLGYYAGLSVEEKANLRAAYIDGENEQQTVISASTSRRMRARSSEAVRVTAMAQLCSLGGDYRRNTSEDHTETTYRKFRTALGRNKSGPNLLRLWRTAESHPVGSLQHNSTARVGVKEPLLGINQAGKKTQTEDDGFFLDTHQESDAITDEDGSGTKAPFATKVQFRSPYQNRQLFAAQGHQPIPSPSVREQQSKLQGPKSLLVRRHDGLSDAADKARSTASNSNNPEQWNECYFNYHPSSVSRQMPSLFMPSTSPEAKTSQAPSLINNIHAPKVEANPKIRSISPSAQHFSVVPLASPALPCSDNLLDISGTRAMLRRRMSAGQLHLGTISPCSTSTLRRSPSAVSCGLANLGHTGMGSYTLASPGSSHVGGGLTMLGLGKAKSAEQLKVKH